MNKTTFVSAGLARLCFSVGLQLPRWLRQPMLNLHFDLQPLPRIIPLEEVRKALRKETDGRVKMKVFLGGLERG